MWKHSVTLQGFIKDRLPPTYRIYVSLVQFSQPQESKDWSIIKIPEKWSFRHSTWTRTTPYSGGSTSQVTWDGVFPTEATISLKMWWKDQKVAQPSLTRWHLRLSHAWMSLRSFCLLAQPLRACTCSFFKLFYVSVFWLLIAARSPPWRDRFSCFLFSS